MYRTIEFANPIRFGRLIMIFRLRGMDVYVQWTVFLSPG
jgi:hypothetical protein